MSQSHIKYLIGECSQNLFSLAELPEGALSHDERFELRKNVNTAYLRTARFLALVADVTYPNDHCSIKMRLVQIGGGDVIVDTLATGLIFVSSGPVKTGEIDRDAARKAALDLADVIKKEADMFRVDVRDFAIEKKR